MGQVMCKRKSYFRGQDLHLRHRQSFQMSLRYRGLRLMVGARRQWPMAEESEKVSFEEM